MRVFESAFKIGTNVQIAGFSRYFKVTKFEANRTRVKLEGLEGSFQRGHIKFYTNKPIEDFPQIYVACLAAYNNGKLHGAWIDADSDVDVMRDAVNEMLASSPEPNAEEYAIHDTENLDLGEYAGLDSVAEYMQIYDEHGKVGLELLNYNCGDVSYTLQMLEEHYHGIHESEETYVYDFIQDVYGHEIKNMGFVGNYIDYEAIHRDFFKFGEHFSLDVDGECHIFEKF